MFSAGCASTPQSPLVQAITKGDTSGTQRLINEGSNINEADKYGMTPLMHAIQYENIEAVKSLIKKGADCNIKDKYGATALHYAAYNYEIMKLLIENGANINIQDDKGFTPLHTVVQTRGDENSLIIAEYLLSKNADTTIKDKEGYTVYRYAILYKNVDMVALIRKKTGWKEEIESLTMNEALARPSHYNPEKDMFDVPADKEKAYKIATYDCNTMSVYSKGTVTILAGPIGYLGSMALDALTMKGFFLKCMAKMGFKCKNNCSNNEIISNKKDDESFTSNQSVILSPQKAAVTDSPSSLEEEWWVNINGQKDGPFKTSKIKELLSSDKITDNAYVWKEGMKNWKMISDSPFARTIGTPTQKTSNINAKQSIAPN